MKVPPFELSTEEIRADLDPIRHPLSIAIIRAKNPFNVGAIIRAAHSFMVKEILLVGDAPFYQRAAMGMDKYENIVELPDDEALVTAARERNLPLVVLERDEGGGSLWKTELPDACIMVFGNEDSGVPGPIVAAADLVVSIPMFGINHSFPVTIAAGIAMAEWTRRFTSTTPERPPRPTTP